jgi:SMODS and SLOG-associating 2TM effector domain 1
VDESTAQALRLYQERRFRDQQSWFGERIDEYKAAQRQAGAIAGVLLVVSAAAAAMGTADLWGDRRAWAIVAAAAAATSAAINAYASTYQFDAVARGYQQALDALGRLEPDRPGPDTAPDVSLPAYVARAEAVLLGEVEHWAATSDSSNGERPGSDSAEPRAEPPAAAP